MGPHPIFESDFDCLTERALTKLRKREKKKVVWARMFRFLRRTFSRRNRNHRPPAFQPVKRSSQHIPSPKNVRETITCHVVLLDGSDITVDVPKSEKGEYLFRKIIMQLDLIEEDYFGLQLMDKNQVPHWLDKTKKKKKKKKKKVLALIPLL